MRYKENSERPRRVWPSWTRKRVRSWTALGVAYQRAFLKVPSSKEDQLGLGPIEGLRPGPGEGPGLGPGEGLSFIHSCHKRCISEDICQTLCFSPRSWGQAYGAHNCTSANLWRPFAYKNLSRCTAIAYLLARPYFAKCVPKMKSIINSCIVWT